MGYQFRLDEVRHGSEVPRNETLRLAIRGENEGVAPFYYSWQVEAALLDEDSKPVARFPLKCDISNWLPGEFAIEEGFEVKAPPGRYNLALGVIDPWTNRPAIQFANKLPTSQGWTVLSELVVTEPAFRKKKDRP